MLGLKLPTDPRWANLAEKSMEEILTDHAYCEQKAASTGISLIQKFPDRSELVDKLSPLVTEEWGHFRMVLAELKRRKLKLGKQRKDEYVNQLMKHERKGDKIERQLMDKLLINALIEARSCERFRLLSENLKEKRMRQFYHHFMKSEAGHYRMFIDLAKKYMSEKTVKTRWNELLKTEAEIIKGLEIRGDRMH